MESAVKMRRDSERIQGSAFTKCVLMIVQSIHVSLPPQEHHGFSVLPAQKMELCVDLIKQHICMSVLYYASTLGWSEIYLNTSLF